MLRRAMRKRSDEEVVYEAQHEVDEKDNWMGEAREGEARPGRLASHEKTNDDCPIDFENSSSEHSSKD